jgi:hypothetical protein
MENYITQGKFYFENGTREVFAGRMPYYGIIYFVVRLFASPHTSYDIISFLQIFTECIAIVMLGMLAYRLSKSLFAFLVTVILATISLYISYWSLYLLPESFSFSFFIFFIYYYLLFKKSGEQKHFYLYTLFLVLLILLKPYYFPVIGFVFFDSFTNNFSFRSFQFSKALRHGLFISIILMLFLSPWIIRNYLLMHRFVPFQESVTAGYNYTEADFACRRFIQAWGGEASQFWDKRSASCYFIPHPELPCEYRFPDYVFVKGYTFSDIETVRNKYVVLQAHYNDSLNGAVSKEFDRLTRLFKAEKPLRYYVIAPLHRIGGMLFHSGSFYLPINVTFKCYKPYQFGLKYLESLLYYFILFFGTAGLIYIYFKDKTTSVLIAIPVYIIVLFCIILKANENRYYMHCYPLLILGAANILEILKHKFICNSKTSLIFKSRNPIPVSEN